MVQRGRGTAHASRPSGHALSGEVEVGWDVNVSRKEISMKWVEPAYCDLRLGFEVTAYVYVR
jgi:pyrroloquinoline quinone biosynthesis protein A